MKVLHELNNLPPFKNAVVTIGSYDGIHYGHSAILTRMVKKAREINGETVVITFHPHPRLVLQAHTQPIQLLQSQNEKMEILEELGIHYLVVVLFNKEFASLTASDYIENFLVNYFKPHTIVIGHDHKFGRNREGNIDLLRSLQTAFNYEVQEISVQEVNHLVISSTTIRQALLDGNIELANEFLCRPFSIEGKVVEGKHLGRTIGYATANIIPLLEEQLVPGIGVYAVRVRLHEHVHSGMMNIGLNPTVSNSNSPKLEVHIFNFNDTIYGESLRVEFVKKMRDEKKFDSLQDLQHQLRLDELEAKRILGI